MVGALAALLAGCSGGRGLQRFECTELIMAVPARIVLYAPDEAAARSAARAAFDRMSALELVMSDYREDSELALLCRRSGGPPVPISDDLFAVLERAGEMSAASGGAFDVTVGPLVRLWRAARRTGAVPEPDPLRQARDLCGADLVVLDRRARTVHLRRPGMALDLGGIGKGFAADAAVATLAAHGAGRCLVDLGGDLAVGEAPPGTAGWRVEVSTGLSGPPARALLLVRGAVATSGDAEQFLQVGGTRYSHIIDPRSGMALSTRRAVVAIARDGATADALASAASVLGPRDGVALGERLDGCAVRIEELSEAGLRVVESRGFPR
jgi:thiamine biosynthesis lipoprotein